jgi:SAM-dependent methyltransferase
MPSVEENRGYWGTLYEWSSLGDEWSAPWGGTETEWHATLLPRVRHFLPAGTVLEIGPGYGRWSGYLIDASDRYVGVDVAETCIASCRERFQGFEAAEFHVNDGRSFQMVDDASVDFAFSFDSLVHADADVIGDYLRELDRILSPGGIGFIHHSNLGEHLGALRRSRALGRMARILPPAQRALNHWRITGWDHSRALSMTAQKFVFLCEGAGLVCVGQEIISWGPRAPRTIDCLSLVARANSHWARPNVVVRNPHFMSEARSASALSRVFSPSAEPTELL